MHVAEWPLRDARGGLHLGPGAPGARPLLQGRDIALGQLLAQISAPLLPSCVTLGKSLNLSVPQFPYP